MDNNRPYGSVILNQNELRMGNGAAVYRWDAEGWYGGNMNRVWFKTEGSVDTGSGSVEEAELQALYARPVSPFFNLEAGVRHDFHPSPSRTWLTAGVEGLAPLYWDVGAYAFVSDGGHAAVRLEASYNLQLTQRLILQPQFEFNVYSASEPGRGIGSGLADMDSGLRLRYEIRRQFAPYVGVTYERKFGRTADYAIRDGAARHTVSFVAGIRAWY